MDRMNVATWLIERGSSASPSGVAVISDSQTITYTELSAMVNKAAACLRERRCEVGSRVLISLPDCVELVAAFLGAIQIGALPVLVSPHVTISEYLYYLEDCDPSTAILHFSNVARLAASHKPGFAALVVGSEDESSGWTSALQAAGETGEPVRVNPSDPAFILYSSGSGGKPKGVLHKHDSIMAACRNFGQGVIQISRHDRTFSISKLYFAYGLGNGLYYPLSVGATTILEANRPTLHGAARIMSTCRPSLFFAVPGFYRLLQREMKNGFRLDWSSVRCAVSAGESLPSELFDWLRSEAGLEIIDGLGSTEMLQTFISNVPGHARPGTCGQVVPNYTVKLVDEHFADVTDGEVGSLMVRGGSSFTRYWKDDELTNKVKKDGWVFTGDKLYKDSEGFFHYVGRVDDTLKISGMWVSPVQAEQALKRLPCVSDAFVCTRTDALGVGQLIAYVVASETDAPPAVAEIRKLLHRDLQEYMIPRAIVFVDDLPRTPNGKVDKHKLPLPSKNEDKSDRSTMVSRETEQEIANMWAALLDSPDLEWDRSFIELGGNSVTAMQCVNRVRERYKVDLDLELLFLETGTVRAIAAEIDRTRACAA